jgi:hypothetical protein
VDLFVFRAAREIGALVASLGGLDGLVFTVGIGEHAPEIRSRVCARCAWLGMILDERANGAGQIRVSTEASRVRVYVIPTDEERRFCPDVGQSRRGYAARVSCCRDLQQAFCADVWPSSGRRRKALATLDLLASGDPTAWLRWSDSNSEMSSQSIPLKGRTDFRESSRILATETIRV